MDWPRGRARGSDYGELVRGRYGAARALGPRALEPWRRAVQDHFRGVRLVLDLGCGTGRFASHIARWTGAHVIGVDPSAAMLREVDRSAGTAYVRAGAEAVPLRAASVDGAWLSQVMHHVDDPARSAAELRRVLRPGASVLVRGNHAGRLEGIVLFRYFPGARRIAERFPTLDATLATFTTAGFCVVATHRILQETCGGLRALAFRAAQRADSTLALLDDDEFATCLATLERDAEAEVEPVPVQDPLDLVVLASPGEIQGGSP